MFVTDGFQINSLIILQPLIILVGGLVLGGTEKVSQGVFLYPSA
jgi:hypothetical protein